MILPVALVVMADGGDYGGHDVYLSGKLIGFRPYDGSDSAEVAAEVVQSLADLLAERLGWARKAPEYPA
jgi:hypothetical protein